MVLPWYLSRHERVSVTWDIEPETDPFIAGNHERITAHVLEHARPGSIILLHVMYASRAPSREALPGIIGGLRAAGYDFATVNELMGHH